MATTWVSGLERLKLASRTLALDEFDAFALSAGFEKLNEEMLLSLLDDDDLRSESEERILEIVLHWINRKSAAHAVHGGNILRKIRLPLMSATYLENEAKAQMVMHGLGALAAEALALKATDCKNAGCNARLELLEAAALTPRRCGQVRWGSYLHGGEQRHRTSGWRACSVALHGGALKLVCAGLWDGPIEVWCRSNMSPHMVLEGHSMAVWAMVSVGELLVSGSADREIRVWDTTSAAFHPNRCQRILRDHASCVTALAATGEWLFSGGWGEEVLVWSVSGPVWGWACVRRLWGGRLDTNCLAMAGCRLACGSRSGKIVVWSWTGKDSGETHRLLRGHTMGVTAIVEAGQRLISASLDGTLKAWSAETWACVQTERVYPGAVQSICRLAVCGSTLVGVSKGYSDAEEYELRVWDLATLAPLHALKQPAGRSMLGLAVGGGEVWATCGRELVVWGWRGRHWEDRSWPAQLCRWMQDVSDSLRLRVSGAAEGL